MNTAPATTASNFDNAPDVSRKQSSVLIVLPKTELFVGDDFLGSVFFNLSKELSHDLRKVTLLVIDHGHLNKAEIGDFLMQCSHAKIDVRYLIRDKYPHLVGPKSACDSYVFFQWLRENDTFDVVHVPDWLGLGYYAQLAKHQGLSFAQTNFIVDVVGNTLWRGTIEQSLITSPEFLATNYLERESLRLADAVFSPVELNLDILKSEGWSLPDSQYRLQMAASAVLPELDRNAESEKADNGGSGAAKMQELVYLGSLDERDGLSTFCDLLDKLVDEIPESCLISFLSTSIAGSDETNRSYLTQRAQRWKWTWQLMHYQTQKEAIEYVKKGSKLAVIGSTTASALWLALRCSLAGVAFYCNANGSRTVPKSDLSVLAPNFFTDEVELGEKLKQVVLEGLGQKRRASPSAKHKQWWKDAHETIFRSTSANEAKTRQPLVSVCLAHYNRPALLRMALMSLKAQDYKNIEVIVGDDGSAEAGVQKALDQLQSEFANPNWKILRLPHRNVGATRTSVAREANGEFLLFMDDDNVAMPNEISTMVKVSARTKADIVTCSFDAFSGDDAPAENEKPLYRKIFLGAAAECGLTENVFGDANALIRKSLYLELGGFDDQPGVAWHDWTFFAKAVLHGAHLESVPEPLLFYRVAANSMNRTSSQWRSAQSVIKEYEQAMPKPFELLPVLLYGLIKGEETSGASTTTDITATAGCNAATEQSAGRLIADASETKPAATLTPPAASEASKTENSDRKASEQAAAAATSATRQPTAAPRTQPPKPLRANRLVKLAWWLVTMQLPGKLLERQKRIKLITSSHLFQSQWYQDRYGAAAGDAVKHYLDSGAAAGYDPGPKFNSHWYRSRYPDCRTSDLTPLEHFLQIGSLAGAMATPEEDPDFKTFDEKWYLERYQDLASVSIMPFAHYLLHGKDEGRAPSQAEESDSFNADWYLARYPDVLELGLDARQHYLTIGKKEGRVPNPDADPDARDFDSEWYRWRYPDMEDSNIPPLMHYLLYGRQEGRLKRPVDGPDTVAATVRERFEKEQPMRMFAVPAATKRVSLLLDNFADGSLLGRRGAAIVVAVLYAKRLQGSLRIVTNTEPVLASKLPELLSFYGIECPKSIEFVTYKEKNDSTQLSASSKDIFITSSWRNTASVLKIVPAERVVYLVQEDERLMLGSRDEALRANEVLANKELRFIVSTSSLYQHFQQEGFGHFQTNGSFFEPVFPSARFSRDVSSNSERKSGKRNFFFYARPDSSANLYYRGLEVIAQALEQKILRHPDWDFYFVGKDAASVRLPDGITAHVRQSLPWPQYTQLLGQMDLGMALMLTPHPGYPVLELAASGAVAVTNEYATKRSLTGYSKNIICASPSIDSLAQAIAEGVKLVNNESERSKNYNDTKLQQNWESSLKEPLERLLARS